MADADGARTLPRSEAERLFETGPVIVAHASLTARRLGMGAPARAEHLLDALELFAFVRPAKFCAPSAVGLALSLGLAEPKGAEAQAVSLREACRLLLDELAANPPPTHEEALQVAETLQRQGWAWGPWVVAAIRSQPMRERQYRGSGLDVWQRLAEWEDQAPSGDPGSDPVSEQAARERLSTLLGRAGLDEARPSQADFAAEVAHAFAPRDKEGRPRVVLAEAGTGVGKTLGYLAPASLWAERNGPSVWISTYTRALQRQIDRESASVFPDPAVRARKAVVRKGRENYLCLLNFQDMVQGSALGSADAIGMALTARWVAATRDGDMTGGDFPGWLPGLFAVGSGAQASPANLVDRRGECVHAACPHYKTCFIEKAIRASRKADIVIANHALVLTQAAFDGAREARNLKTDVETTALRRVVFDEGHHLFDAADSAFSACLSGQEAAELRRWIRGPEGRGRRGRGLEQRLGDVVADYEGGREALNTAIRAAAALPGEGWSGRIAPPSGEVNPIGPVEALLAAVMEQLKARNAGGGGMELGMECHAHPVTDAVAAAAPAAARAIAAVEAPLLALARALEDILDDEAAELDTSQRARIEGALRGLDRRARMTLPAWRSMLKGLEGDPDYDCAAEEDPDFVDWFSSEVAFGRIVDASLRRHWIDPTVPLEAAVIAPAHGVLVASATLTDPVFDDPFELARLRTGSARLAEPPKEVRLESPFDYAANARVLVVGDVGRDDPRQVAAAMRELFLAAGGGALGLFTAIRRLRATYELLGPALARQGLSLYAQHVDPLEVGALVDIFRAEENSCLLGTDAIRDGVDVPGRALRLIAFDRVPWPRPDILHKARRARFGGKAYDDAVARARVAQAFGRLIRRADDKGVFVLLDAAAPTRLFGSLPAGVEIRRLGLVEAIEEVQGFLNPC
ncbi:MAG: ATP-dependent DNA helicase [Caulobacteraceae bacterium]|nr:ATP-dependent DNA helicase [Caulobacteraceae bacterium]